MTRVSAMPARRLSRGRMRWVGAAALVAAIAATRYSAAGGMDPTFGTGGKVITGCHEYDDYAEALVLTPDGKLVAAGSVSGGSSVNFTFLRYAEESV